MSCAITPISWPVCSDLSFQSKDTPFICFILSIGCCINSILSFKFSSEVWYAVISPVDTIEPLTVKLPPIVVAPPPVTLNTNLS